MTKEEQALSDKSSKRPAVRVISPGLVNLGNTCFANSIDPCILGFVADGD
jgi:ubiquitin C-terminal hydrolase